MINPHGSEQLTPLYTDDPALLEEAESLPSLTLNSAAAANAVMLGAGYFTPLAGYMNLEEAACVAETMFMTDGLFWPVPILNRSDDISAINSAGRITLRDPNIDGNPILGIQEVSNIETMTDDQLSKMTEQIFGTLSDDHPGVSTFRNLGKYVISGPIHVFNYSYFERDFPETFRTAVQIREDIRAKGWEKIVAFQTRNPMHRAHEELCKMALEAVSADGILIHMLLGKLKPGDVPADVRDAAIRKMVELYFPENTVMVTGYGFDMLYAGPKEAALHAVFRQNAGCTHLIVGRDHAGVGDYYGPFDAQTIFDEQIPDDALSIRIFKADHTAWSKKLNRVVMMRDVPDHTPEDFVLLSGTKVREMLAAGKELPVEFAHPEVAHILMDHYQRQNS